MKHRDIRSPLTTDQLTPVEPGTWLQIPLSLQEEDYELLGAFLATQPRVTLNFWSTVPDLEFLRYTPHIAGMRVQVSKSFDGLRYLEPGVTFLGIGSKNVPVPLNLIEKQADLKVLSFGKKFTSIDSLGALKKLERLGLNGMTLDNFSFLRGLDQLHTVITAFGTFHDYRHLADLPVLRTVDIIGLRANELHGIEELSGIELLRLEWLRNVIELPSCAKMKRLKTLLAFTLKSLCDISGVADAPALEKITMEGVPQLTVDSFRPFVGHPTLRQLSIAGSKRRERAILEMLNLKPNAAAAN